MADVPPIPATCANRPTIGGLVKPWVNVELADGGIDFRGQHRTRAEQAITQRLCQVCGTKLWPASQLRQPIVLLGGPDQLQTLMFGEPPLHTECAAYTSRACPMIAGRMTHYPDRPRVMQGARGAVCPLPGCDCGGWVNHDTTPENAGQPAVPWYAVYTTAYTWARDQHGTLLALTAPTAVRAVRLVSRPGEGRCWQLVPDALTDHQPPTFAEAPP
jgi:hypothetical protein